MGVGVLKGECFIFDKEGVGKSKNLEKSLSLSWAKK